MKSERQKFVSYYENKGYELQSKIDEMIVRLKENQKTC